jgi:hypothetical protein
MADCGDPPQAVMNLWPGGLAYFGDFIKGVRRSFPRNIYRLDQHSRLPAWAEPGLSNRGLLPRTLLKGVSAHKATKGTSQRGNHQLREVAGSGMEQRASEL